MPTVGSASTFPNGFNYYDDILRTREPGTTKVIWQTEGGFFGGFTTLDLNTAASYARTAWTMWNLRQLNGQAGPYILFELHDNAHTNNDGSLEDPNNDDSYLGNYTWHTNNTFTAKPQLAVWTELTTATGTVDPPPPPPPPPPQAGDVLFNAQNQTLTWGSLFGSPTINEPMGSFGTLIVAPPPDPGGGGTGGGGGGTGTVDPTNPPPPTVTGVDWTFSLNGTSIGLAPYLLAEDGPDVLGWDQVRSSDTPRPSGDGAISLNPDFMATRLIDLPVLINTFNQVDALTSYRALANAWQRSSVIEMMEITTPIGPFQVFGRPRRFVADLKQLPTTGMITATARFEATDPLFYSDPRTIVGTPSTVTGGLSLPFSMPFSLGGANAGGVTVNNGGNTSTSRVVIIITASAGGFNNPRLEQLTDGQALLFNIALSAGQKLWIDFAAKSVKLDNTESRSATLVRPDSTWWSIPPGTHDIRFGGTGNATISLTYQSAYIF